MKKNISNLIAEFVTNTIKSREGIMAGDARFANRYYKKAETCYKKLNKLGAQALDEMASLLKHDNSDVRVAAAACLLGYKTDMSLNVLNAEAKSGSLASHQAAAIVDLWKKGELKCR